MPTGPKGQKRPADVIGNAVRVMRIATGEEADDVMTTARTRLRRRWREGRQEARREHDAGAARRDCRKAAASRWKNTTK